VLQDHIFLTLKGNLLLALWCCRPKWMDSPLPKCITNHPPTPPSPHPKIIFWSMTFRPSHMVGSPFNVFHCSPMDLQSTRPSMSYYSSKWLIKSPHICLWKVMSSNMDLEAFPLTHEIKMDMLRTLWQSNIIGTQFFQLKSQDYIMCKVMCFA